MMMAAHYESDFVAQKALILGLAANSGLDATPVSQSRRMILKFPPSPQFNVVVLEPVKQGGNWHYGGRIVAAGGSGSTSDQRNEYIIRRKWEDCLDLQRTLEREFSFISSQRRKRVGDGFYQGGSQRAASFESLPSGPEPLIIALDVHQHLPKLSKKTALFGANADLLHQRAADFRSLIEALFSVDTPAMEELRSRQIVRDWFAYWQRDYDCEKKAGISRVASPPPMNNIQPGSLHMTMHPPTFVVSQPLGPHPSSASSISGSSSESRPRSLKSDSGDDEVRYDSHLIHPPRLSSLSNNSVPSPRTPPPLWPSRNPEAHFVSGYLSINGMMAPVSARPRSQRKSSATPTTTISTKPQQVKEVEVVEASNSIVAPPPRHRSRSTGANSAHRNGRVFVSVPSSPAPPASEDHPSNVPQPDPPRPKAVAHTAHTSQSDLSTPGSETDASSTVTPPPRPPRAASRGYGRPPPSTAPSIVSTSSTLMSSRTPSRAHPRYTMDSFVDVKLPFMASAEDMEAIHQAPAIQSRHRPRRSRGTNHSISSIEAYLSDSSIDAAFSQIRASHSSGDKSVNGGVAGAPPSLRRSFSSGASPGTRRSSVRVSRGAYPEEVFQSVSPDAYQEDDDFVEAYFYSSQVSPGSVRVNSQIAGPRQSLSSTKGSSLTGLHSRGPSIQLPQSLTFGDIHFPSTPSPSASHSISSISASSVPSTHTSPNRAGPAEDSFCVKVFFPSAVDCPAIVCKFPRNITFVEAQDRLEQKFQEAEGICFSDFEHGFTIARVPPGTLVSSRASISSSSTGRRMSGARPSSMLSFNSVDSSSQLRIITNQAEWEAAIPVSNEKLTLKILVEEF